MVAMGCVPFNFGEAGHQMHLVLSNLCDCHVLRWTRRVNLKKNKNFSLAVWLHPGPQWKVQVLRGEWMHRVGAKVVGRANNNDSKK